MFKNNILIISIIAVLLLVIATWFFSGNETNIKGNAFNVIPNDAALIIEIDKPNDIYRVLNADNSLWSSMLEIAEIRKLNNNIAWLDTLFTNQSSYLQELVNGSVTFALYTDSVGVADKLVLIKTKGNFNLADAKDELVDKIGNGFAIFDVAQVPNVYKVVDVETEQVTFFTFVDGLFVYSSSVDLISRVLENKNDKNNKLIDNHAFAKVRQSSGKKVHARLYIQYKYFSVFIKPFVIPNHYEAINWIGNFAEWTEVDILIKNNELIFSGFSMYSDTASYLYNISQQTPVKLKAVNVIPYNVNMFLWTGFSNFHKYFANSNSTTEISSITKKINLDVNKLIQQIGEEVVFCSSDNLTTNSWLIASVKNQNSAKQLFAQVAKNTGSKKTTKHNDYTIRKINVKNFLPSIFGDAYNSITNNYYTFVGNYIIFANSASSLMNLIDYFETGKTLDLNDNFKSFSDNISSQSNLLFYIKPPQFITQLSNYLSSNVVKKIELNKKAVNSFQGIALQISGSNNLMFTNLYVKHGKVHHEENLALWKVKLDDEIIWGPFLVNDHKTKNKNTIVFDKLGNMYLINFDGQILWKKKLDAVPISNVYEIDYYKNKKLQYLFNTNSFIYLLDANGNNVTGYPKKLHTKATNGISVFDYKNNRDYRLVVAQADKRIYNYTKKGKEVKGWKLPKMQNIVVDEVERLLANKKDYIIINDIEGDAKIVNRKGKSRINISGKFTKAKHSSYYVNRTNSKGIIITTNEKGKLVYISASGRIKYTDFGDFSKNHFFLYEDFNGDNSKDFIFIDGKMLKVFDRFKKELFSYKFGSEITIKPLFFNLGRKHNALGVVANAERTIYLFDKNGNTIISKGLVGETPFIVGDIKNNNKINLISVSGNTLYNYRLK